ncbi:MAG: endonuclease [Segetibacter sp.]|nr:endonuclease [Segetibacter sp.]
MNQLIVQKNRLYIICMLLFITVACNRKQYAASSGPGNNVIKVMTYNIHHANPPSREGYIDLNAIAQVIQKEQPDLVALQEVDVHTKRSGSTVSEADEIASKTGMNVYFAKAIDHDGGDYGLAILSRFPLSAQHTYKLPTAEGTKGEHRVLATAEISLPGNHKLVFACTHLDAQKGDTNRLLQINAIRDVIQKEKFPVIIGGDFNASTNSRVINILDEYLRRTCLTDCGFTIPVKNPNKTIDFIAYTQPGKLSTISHKVIDEQYASDHLPVLSVIDVKQ